MKRIPQEIQSALDAEVAHLTTCIRITRQDGVVARYVDNTRYLAFADALWSPAGYDMSAITNSVSDATGNLDLSGFFSSALEREEVRGGKYDHAKIEVFQINREQPPATVGDETVLWLFSGRTGQAEVKPDGHGYKIEARSLIQMLQQNVGSLTSGVCRAEFGSLTGDEPCGVDPAGYTATASVESVTSNRLIKAPALAQIIDYFGGGRLTWTSGENIGDVAHVAQYAPGLVVLLRPAGLPIAAGDTFSIVAGCDHTVGTCAAKFNNAINFQGEPLLPGFDPWFARGVL